LQGIVSSRILPLQGRLSLLLRFERRAGGVPCAVAQPLAGRADRPQERKIRRPDLNVKEFYGSGFPSLSWLDQTPESALKGVREIVESVIKDMKLTDEEIPQPIAGKRYSGKFMVRVPPEVHRNLAMQASESGVSLNRIVGAKLSR